MRGIRVSREPAGCACLCLPVYVCVCKQICLKELAHMLMDDEKPTVCWVDCQAAAPEGPMVQSEFKSCLPQNACSGEVILLFYVDLQLIAQGPPTLWRAIGFTQSSLM